MKIIAPDLNISLIRAFTAVVDESTVTAAARRISRTQPALTLRIKRLEAALGTPLFTRNRRRLILTSDGELLLPYARELLRVNEEARACLSQFGAQGRVILGTPDLYAAYLLPTILTRFSSTYVGVEIELRCTLSSHLHQAVSDSEVDLALLTKIPGHGEGTFVRHEPLVWVSHPDTRLHNEAVLPLAMLPKGIYRDLALKALHVAGREWRITCVSESISGLQAAVFADLSISVLIKSAVGPGMKILGPADGLPKLPDIELILRRKSGPASDAAVCLADYVIEHLGTSKTPKRRKPRRQA